MDMQRSTMTTMSEIVSGNNNNATNNKRKRRTTLDDKDIENQRPPTKKIYSPPITGGNGVVGAGNVVGMQTYETKNLENEAIEFEVYQSLGSTQTIGIVTKVEHQHQQKTTRTATNYSNNNNIINKQIPTFATSQPANSSLHNQPTNINNNISSTITNNTNNVGNAGAATCGLIASTNGGEVTPQSHKNKDLWNSCANCSNATTNVRLCPLPVLSWADAKEVWRFMCKKDEKASIERDSKMLRKHPGIQPRMRAILLDWLIEVCEVYKLHRETYYLALDYLDRYLSTNISISKTYLQLIGITCLFIAAKVEEIYPPKLSEFAYVTDGACREEDILKQELIILTALKWQINPVTIMGWLSVYMQLNVSKRMPKTISPVRTADTTTIPANTMAKTMTSSTVMAAAIEDGSDDGDQHHAVAATTTTTIADEAFVFPQFSGLEFAQTAQLIDLCTLDLGIANFAYSVIAAAAISHTFNKKTAIKLSGLDWATISPCSRWMEPFFRICIQTPKLCLLENNEQVHSTYGLGHICPNITTDDSHIIQMHSTNMDMFDEVMLCMDQLQHEASPALTNVLAEHTCPPPGLLTPPASNRKFIEGQPDSTCK